MGKRTKRCQLPDSKRIFQLEFGSAAAFQAAKL